MHQGPPALWPEPSPQESLQETGNWPGVHFGAELRPHATLADSRSTEPWTHRLCHLPPATDRVPQPSPQPPPKSTLETGATQMPLTGQADRPQHLRQQSTAETASGPAGPARDPTAARAAARALRGAGGRAVPDGQERGQAAARSQMGGREVPDGPETRQRGRVAARSQAGGGPTISPGCRLSHAPSPHTHPTLCLLRHHRTSRSNRMLGVPDDTRATPPCSPHRNPGSGRERPL